MEAKRGSNTELRVALAQVDCALGDIAENAGRAREAIARAREGGADLIVFPELSLSGYALGAVALDVALRADDPAITGLADEAGDMGIVIGFVEEGPVHTYNTAVHLQGGRALHVQRKNYLPTYGRFEEHKHFRPGQSLRAYDTPWGRFALLICNDAWQAPLSFIAVHDGARVLIVPACSSLAPEAGPQPPAIEADWGHLLRFHARFMQSWVVFVNRVGDEAGLRFWGGSRVLDPWGETAVEAPRGEPALVYADLDIAAVRRARRELPLVKEPRLELLTREFGRLADGDG
jgi:predicted amidohydrolase